MSILVTGIARSGTTWVGQMIGTSNKVAIIDEPFHYEVPNRFCDITPAGWYMYVYRNMPGVEQYEFPIERCLEYRHDLLAVIRKARSLGGCLAALKLYRETLKWRCFSRPILLFKDPHAVLASEWLAERFGFRNIVLIRHPAAFVSSYLRLGWKAGPSHFLNQERLMEEYLHVFHDELEQSRQAQDWVANAALEWKCIYYVVHKFREKHPDWMWIRHEDLSRDPVGGFEEIYRVLDLPFTESCREVIQEHSSPSNPMDAPEGVLHQLKRDSKANILVWKKRLTPNQICTVKEKTAGVSDLFYTDADW